jgi:DNA-binding NtrC family response regulator
MRQNRAIVATATRVRVLVVEDNPDILDIYEDTLHAAGYDVDAAGSLAQAEHAIVMRKPDLVILDCRLPDGCGIDLLRRWKASTEMSGVPIVMVTANSGTEYIRAASAAGADAFLVKPCWDDLTPFLARIVQAARTAERDVAPQCTTKRPRYRMSSRPPAALRVVPRATFDDHDGRLLARCNRCFRSSPMLGKSCDDAERHAIDLGWATKSNGWACPVCISRYGL